MKISVVTTHKKNNDIDTSLDNENELIYLLSYKRLAHFVHVYRQIDSKQQMSIRVE